jgi:hypothetical protein
MLQIKGKNDDVSFNEDRIHLGHRMIYNLLKSQLIYRPLNKFVA